MCKVITICNQKGGVGKTTTTVNLGIGIAKKGYRVLLVDCDPQGNLTTSLGYIPDELTNTLATGMQYAINDECHPAHGKQLILHSNEGVDFVPANIDLAGADAVLVNAMERERTLKTFLNECCDIENNYDYVLIDCLPSLSMLMQNALTAADEVLIPIVPNYLSATGMIQLLASIKRIKKRLNPDLEIAGLVFTMVDANSNLTKEVIDAISQNYGEELRIFNTKIPRTVKVAEAPAKAQSVFEYAKNHKVAKAYSALVDEYLREV